MIDHSTPEGTHQSLAHDLVRSPGFDTGITGNLKLGLKDENNPEFVLLEDFLKGICVFVGVEFVPFATPEERTRFAEMLGRAEGDFYKEQGRLNG